MPVNIAYCSGDKTLDGHPLLALNAVGDPAALLLPLHIRAGAAGHGRVIFKYFGESGCVCGVNDCGLLAASLSNYSRLQDPQSGHTGRELADIALCRCETPDEAVDKVISLLASGLRGDQKNTQCALVFALGNEILLLETAGELWAVKKLTEFSALCGEYTIDGSCDRCHDFCKKHPKAKNGALNFVKAFGDSKKANSTGASLRRFVAVQELYNALNGAPIRSIKDMLLGTSAARHPAAGISPLSMRRVVSAHGLQSRDAKESMCLHPDVCHTQMVNGSVIFSPETGICFYTPFGVPCSSLYVPFMADGFIPFGEDENSAARTALEWEFVRRSAECGIIKADRFESALAAAQEKLDLCYTLMASGSDTGERAANIAADCLAELKKNCNVAFSQLSAKKLGYRKDFKLQNERLQEIATSIGLSI